MPRKGDKCIVVTEKIHQEIRRIAQARNCTMKEYIEYLIAKERNASGGK